MERSGLGGIRAVQDEGVKREAGCDYEWVAAVVCVLTTETPRNISIW